MTESAPTNPFVVLGVPQDADEAMIRARYLELVKAFPPDREPERFREVRAAFEAVQDPLVLATRLLEPPDLEAPSWETAIEEQRQVPPPLSPEFLLSLGNREPQEQPPASDRQSEATEREQAAGSSGSDPNSEGEPDR